MCIFDVYGPCSCPHGKCYTILAQFFAIGSFVTSTIALTSCFFVSVRPIPQENEIELPKEGFGWIARQMKVKEPASYGKQCVFYSAFEREQYFDPMWNAGFAMATIASFLGLIVMSLVLCTCCIAYDLKMFEGLFWTCMICFIAQALTFLSFGSDLCTGELEMECTWSSGTGMNLTAAMMWVWAANMIKSFPEALAPPKRGKKKRRRRDDDDNSDGDDYLRNANGSVDDYDDEYDDDGGGGYYDDDGNWVENGYNDDGYDSHPTAGYDDYDTGDEDNWAEESDATTTTNNNYDDDDDDDDSSEEESEEERQTKSKGKKKKKRQEESEEESEEDDESSAISDDSDENPESFKYASKSSRRML